MGKREDDADGPLEEIDPGREPLRYLRERGMPRLERLVRSIEAAGHRTAIQDLLDIPEPALRLLVWPRPGRMERPATSEFATLEISFGRESTSWIEARWWMGSRPAEGTVTELDQISTLELTDPWVSEQVTDFLEALLRQL